MLHWANQRLWLAIGGGVFAVAALVLILTSGSKPPSPLSNLPDEPGPTLAATTSTTEAVHVTVAPAEPATSTTAIKRTTTTKKLTPTTARPAPTVAPTTTEAPTTSTTRDVPDGDPGNPPE